MSKAKQLREQLQTGWVFGAGCFDALSARLAEHVGFRALHVTGFGVEATQLGVPDIGLITMPELAAHIAHITAVVDIPAIVDIDTGFGGIDNVMRTIREVERAGAGGVHIEDQVFPKRCPVLPDRRILPAPEAVGRVRAALAARSDPDFVIVARSDADAISFSELVLRCNLYLEAGADVAMPMLSKVDDRDFHRLDPRDQLKWLRRLVAEIDGPVLGLNIPDGFTITDMREIGFTVFILPTLSLTASASAMLSALREALSNGTAVSYFDQHPVEIGAGLGIMDLLGLERYLEQESKFGPTLVT